MIARWRLWLGGALLVAVIGAALYFPALRRQVNVAKQLTEKTAEQARRELLDLPTITLRSSAATSASEQRRPQGEGQNVLGLEVGRRPSYPGNGGTGAFD